MTSELDQPFTVGQQLIDRFRADGFVKIKKVLSGPTIAEYEPVITSKVIELNTMHLTMAERSTYQKAFLQVINLWRQSEQVARFVLSRRLAGIAAELLGVSGVRLYHDQALYKEAGGGITPWHADQYYWPLSSDRVCTVWVPLQQTAMEMGPLAFSAGSHEFEFGRDLSISDESESALRKALAEQRFPLVEEPFELGEVSYHLGWTFHRAGENRSHTPRRVMTIIYMDAEITATEPVNDHARADLHTYLGGAPPGTVPDSPLTPLLYRR